jgi:hypothetical protein
MRLFRGRRWSRLVAVTLLLATAYGLPHIAQDDGCVEGTLAFDAQHDESRHAFRPDTVAERDHCAICHWSRSLRVSRVPVGVLAAQIVQPSFVLRIVGRIHVPPVLENLPARAPPAPLL